MAEKLSDRQIRAYLCRKFRKTALMNPFFEIDLYKSTHILNCATLNLAKDCGIDVVNLKPSAIIRLIESVEKKEK